MYEGMNASAAFGLGNLVFMMRENQIAAAAMEVKGFAQILHAHGRAFNMPAGTTGTPRALPSRLARFSGFPQRKIHRIMLAVINVYTCTSHHILNITAGKLSIVFKFFYTVENIAVNNIAIAIVNQALNGFDDIIDMLGYTRINMRTAHIEFIHYFKVGVNIAVADIIPLYALFIGSVDNLVINIGKVLYMGYVIAFMLQKAADNVPGYERTRITNMRMVVRSNTANIDVGFARMNRYEFFFLFG